MTKRVFPRVAGAFVVAGIAALTRSGSAGAESGADESMKVELGRRLFFEPAVGRRGRVGCADCHLPEKGFSDPRQRSQDEDRLLPRHSQPSVDLAGEGFHWDGEFPTVRELVDSRVLPAAEAKERADQRGDARIAAAASAGHAADADQRRASRADGYGGTDGQELVTAGLLAEATPVAVRLGEDARYDDGFRLAFGDASITPRRVGDAIEAYVRSLRTSQNGLDRFLAGDQAALAPAAQRGLELFRGKSGCSQCHVLEQKESRAALTDGKFHDTGVAFRGGVAKAQGAARSRRAKAQSIDVGRASATLLPDDEGAFKTPSLRDVARRGPFMHDGSFASLADVVAYYDQGGTANPHLDSRIRPLGLSADERADLVTFLESLSGAERTGLGDVPGYRPDKLRVAVEGLDGKPLAGLRVHVVPCGDRLRGADAMPEPFDSVTGRDGVAEVALPKSTHVRLAADDYELGLSRPIPDWVAWTTMIATPKTVVSVRVRRSPSRLELPNTFTAVEFSAGQRKSPGTTGDRIARTLTRVRSLSEDEAVYMVAVEPTNRRAAVALVSEAGTTPMGIFEIDFAGGAAETIDLADAEVIHPELPQLAALRTAALNGLAGAAEKK